MPGPANLEGMQKRPGPETICVDLPTRIEPRVKIWRCLLHAQDTHVGKEVRIDGEQPSARGESSCGHIGVSDLAEGVDASIGSPRAMDHDSTADQLLQRALQMILHRIVRGLTLPASESPTIVGNGKL